MLVDSHCHLDFPDFAAERNDVVARARAAGVKHFLTICTEFKKAQSIIDIAKAYDDVSASIGTHPEHASEELDVSFDDIVRLTRAEPKVIGIGECGLDYHYEGYNKDDQARVFRTHIQASLETGLPLIIHTREAEDDTIRILKEEAASQKLQAVLHCFTSSQKLAEQGLELGLFISFSGIITFKNATALRETVKIVPLDRLLVETDAPFLAPVPYRGKRNEPAFVKHTAQEIAVLKGIDPAIIEQATTENFFGLFKQAKA